MHVLLCEHDGPVARLMELSLTRLGHQVTSVGTWAAAMDELSRSVPYLLVIDTSLPDVTTRDAVETIRADEQTSRIHILLIGRTRGNYDGPEPFLQKPFDPSSVLSRMR